VSDRWHVAAALVDRSRRALYDYVRRQNHPVSREEAAEAHRMSRNTAAFHLDKLVDAGLLRARYEAPAGQPRGRGRAPKVYEATGDGLALTVPERRYGLLAEIFADAVADDPTNAADAARRHANQHGYALGSRLRSAGRTVDIVSVLEDLGFEPRREPSRVLLHNCPFHALAARHTELVCGLNHSFLCGLVEGLAAAYVSPRLAPRPGACCVELARAAPAPVAAPADPA
jgi:predicted ArsR family transcriptional regulator